MKRIGLSSGRLHRRGKNRAGVFFHKKLSQRKSQKEPNPGEFKPSLWLDASELDSSGETWNDRSERENHAKRHGSPMVIAHKASGLKVMKFDSQKNDYHEWKEITGIRSVFWVMSKKAGNHGSPLSHPSVHHFYSNGSKFWHPQHTHENVRKGKLRVNGAPGDASSPYPNQLSVVSLVTPGKVTASRIGKDRGFGGKYNWDGEIGDSHLRTESGEEADREFPHRQMEHQRKPKTSGALAYLSFDGEGNRYPNSQPRKGRQHQRKQQGSGRKLGKGIQFTGDDVLNFPSGFGDFNRHQSFSMAFWAKPSQLLDRAVIARRSKAWTDAASRGYEVLIEDGRLSPALIHFWPGNAIRIRSQNRLALNEWTHVGLTYDGSSRAKGLKLYENAKAAEVEVIKDHLTREITGGGDPFLGFAQRMRDRGFKNGMLDEFYLFDRVITPSEISSLAGLAEESGEDIEKSIFLQAVHDPAVSARRALYNERKSFGDQRQRLTEIMVMKEMQACAKRMS